MESECQNQTPQSNTVILDIQESEIIRLDAICRLCANQSEKVIGIYSEEGISNDLAIKMNLYLPVKITETDSLPLQCCWNCASTVLAWHELIVASVEADRRLRELQIVSDKQLSLAEDSAPKMEISTNVEEAESTAASLTVFYQSSSPTPVQPKVTKKKRKEVPETSSGLSILKTEDIVQEIVNESFDDVDIGNSFMNDYESDMDDVELKLIKDEVKLETIDDKVKISKPKESAKRKRNKKQITETIDSGSIEIKPDWIEKDKLSVYNFACQYCSLLYVNEDDIMQHVKEKHADKVDLVQTDSTLQPLGKKEKRKHSKIDQDAVNAAKVVVDGRVYYNCKTCGKSLYSPYTYIWHIRIHTGERPYVCDLCGKQFRVSQGLVRHLRETHEGIKNFPCDICGRMFSTRRNVEEHRRIHTNERPYICDLCGKSFKQKASLFVHNRSHTDYFPYRCSYCNQGFRTRPPLLIHVTRHTGEKPYPCDICGRCFRIKYELKRHRLIHSDEKPFSCTECGLSFRQKRYLRNHNKVNHNRATS